MTGRTLERIKGYTTFRELDLDLRPINVLIGANGAGKSNLITLFTMLFMLLVLVVLTASCTTAAKRPSG